MNQPREEEHDPYQIEEEKIESFDQWIQKKWKRLSTVRSILAPQEFFFLSLKLTDNMNSTMNN